MSSPSPSSVTKGQAPPTHLIIVCCHGIFTGDPEASPTASQDESNWLIAGFQKGETPTFVEHARIGVECLSQDLDNAVLVFSGGPTRSETRLSEAESYFNVCRVNCFWDLLPLRYLIKPGSPRILFETRALDSYHNVLFSLTLFLETYETCPLKITVVSHLFKKERLVKHCQALKLPGSAVEYIGADPPGMNVARGSLTIVDSPPNGGAKTEAMKGVAHAVKEWDCDPHGRGQSLRNKRERRNPWTVWQGLFSEEMKNEQIMKLVPHRVVNEVEVLDENDEMPWS